MMIKIKKSSCVFWCKVALYAVCGLCLLSCASRNPYEVKSPCVANDDPMKPAKFDSWYKNPCIRRPANVDVI